MSHITRFDHTGITVANLDAVEAFFVTLGLEVEGRGTVQGEFVETVCGIAGATCDIVMLKSPDGVRLEVCTFVTPDNIPSPTDDLANVVGIRNVSFEVDDLQAAVDAVAAEGYGLVAGIGEHEGMVKMAYVRGPEGIVVSLFQYLGQ
ncbi:VOC family protein [Aeromicrobium panaciterrae]|uniref:VOC family protein n=1 Tax=Aeromicrobium panaciterrae TaxID=363861 RepID=UPI0031E3ABCF